MTGPEHFRESERLLSQASRTVSDTDPEPVLPNGRRLDSLIDVRAHSSLLSRASVHATLALAAATAWPSQIDGNWSPGDYGIPTQNTNNQKGSPE